MSIWRITLVPGLLWPEVSTALAPLIQKDSLLESRNGSGTLLSGLPVCVLQHRIDGLWRNDFALSLSERIGGWVLSADCNTQQATWGILLAHAGQTTLFRRQAQEAGTESALGPEFDKVWNRLGQELFGESSTAVVRQFYPACLVEWGDVPSPTIPEHRWWILTEDTGFSIGQLPGLFISRRLISSEQVTGLSSHLAILNGVGIMPPDGLFEIIRKQCPDAVLLSHAPSPLEVNMLAIRLGTVPGAFVAPQMP